MVIPAWKWNYPSNLSEVGGFHSWMVDFLRKIHRTIWITRATPISGHAMKCPFKLITPHEKSGHPIQLFTMFSAGSSGVITMTIPSHGWCIVVLPTLWKASTTKRLVETCWNPINCLVVYLPLWKILWKSVGIIIPSIWKKTYSKPPTSKSWDVYHRFQLVQDFATIHSVCEWFSTNLLMEN